MFSDATRTFGLGSISKESRTVYEIVKESQKAGLKAVKPQKTCASVDYACRKIIEEHNYGPHFIHSTGHGIGLDVHENPNISAKNKEKLKKGMAITVEPGIYIPKKFGVRIEDSLIVKDSASVMHKFTKDLIVNLKKLVGFSTRVTILIFPSSKSAFKVYNISLNSRLY